MSLDAWIVLAMLAAMFALLIATKWPAWIIFLATLTAAITLRVAPEAALLKGFANSGVLTVAVLFMVAAGMYRTGAITLIADRLLGRPRGDNQALRRLLGPLAFASAFLNNTPLVAMMIPVVRDLGRSNDRVNASTLYMPISFATILGGAATLIGTSTNLIVAGLVVGQIAKGQAQGLSEINVFTPTAVGLPAAVVGLVFLLLAAGRLMPKRVPEGERHDPQRRFLAAFVVDPHGPLVGRGLAQSGLDSFAGCELTSHQGVRECTWLPPRDAGPALSPKGIDAEVVAVRHAFRKVVDVAEGVLKPPLEALRPRLADGDVMLQGGDVLIYVGALEAITALWQTIGLRAAIAPVKMAHEPYTHRLVEVVMSETSEAVGHHVVHLPLEYKHIFHAKVVGVALTEERAHEKLADMRVQPGDTLLLEVTPSFLYDARNEADFALVRRLHGYKIKRTSRAPIAGGIALTMVLLASFGVMTMLNAALLATLALIVTGCLSLSTAIKSIELDTVIVLGAAVGLESAVTNSGLATGIANALVYLGGANPWVALAVIFVGAIVTTNVINAAAAAALLFPVAVGMATKMDVSAMPFVMAMMIAASYSFVNPAGFQTNLMVQKPGGYTFGDFTRLGLPLSVLVTIVVCVVTPLVFPFALP
ncbi:MAG: SLC13 family permease [Thermoleophilia bacterium]